MKEVTLVEAWKIWLLGDSTSNLTLWGMKILWWGRLGKIVTFVAALTIIIDLIGTDRIRNFGKSLHRVNDLSKAKEALWVSLIWNVRWFQKDNRYHELMRKVNMDESGNYFIIVVVYFLSISYFGLQALSSFLGSSNCLMLPISIILIVIFAMVSFILADITSFLLSSSFTIIGLCLDFLFIDPIAWLLDNPSFDKLIKITNVLMLIIGFHFDLLSS